MGVLTTLPLVVNIGLFAAAAAGVWVAGTALARFADVIADKKKLGKAMMGLVFLATATSLPELSTTIAAAIAGSAPLVLGNLFGGITMQTAILAVTDAFVVRGALTFYPRRATHALEAVLLVLLLTLLLGLCVLGDRVVVFNIGFGTLTLAFGYILAIRLLRAYDKEGDWVPVDLPDEPDIKDGPIVAAQLDRLSVKQLCGRAGLAAVAILVFGVILVHAAEAIAAQSGLGASFVGVVFLAAATSLPELSTTIAAARLGAYTMAISNIFGSNLIMLALLLPADALYRPGAILAAAGQPEFLALVAGSLVTIVYIAGLLVRRKPQLFGMGLDSVLVLVIYLASVVALFVVQ